MEGILGLQRRGAAFTLNPCIPSSWPSYSIEWRFGTTHYTIVVENPQRRCRGVASVEVDGAPTDPAAIPLSDDGRAHRVQVVLGAGPDAPSAAAAPAAQRAEDAVGLAGADPSKRGEMKVSPFVGEPAESFMLGNMPRPTAARSAVRPGPSVSEHAVQDRASRNRLVGRRRGGAEGMNRIALKMLLGDRTK